MKQQNIPNGRKYLRADMCVIGFALFSMFFGAGNVIFPPYLGMESGPQWLSGFISYYIADIGLALAAMLAVFKTGDAHKTLEGAGKIPAEVMMCIIVLCLGPMFAIPRTAAMTFEMSVAPLIKGVNSVVFSIVFFGVVFLCTAKESSVVDIVGKVMTPALLLGLVILIIKGIADPAGEIRHTPYIGNVIREGISAGYQTMDVLATMLFGGIILKSAESKGYTDTKEKTRVAAGASIIACVLLLIVYGGLSYLGAGVSTVYDPTIGRSHLMIAIVYNLLGRAGTVIFAIVVALACLTTAVGLVSSVSRYFAELFKEKISYTVLTAVVCVFSAVVSNVGLEQLISVAGPILDVVYPPTLVLIGASFFEGLSKSTVRLTASGALIYSLISVFGLFEGFRNAMPFHEFGFGWILPAVVCCLAGCLIFSNKK